MGTVISLIVGVLAALNVTKKDLYQPWIYLVNVSLAVYLSIFLSPLFLELLPALPGAADRYRTAGVLLISAVIFLMVFYKLVGTVAEDARVFELYSLPPLVSNLCAVLFAFCGGVVTASFLLMCFAQTPAAAGIKGIDRSALRASSVGVMRIMARSVNAFSFQSMSSAAEETLSGLEKDPPPVPEETLEEKVKAKKAAAKKAARKTVKKMRILENGVAVPVEEEKTPTETGESRTDSPEQTPRSNDTSSDVTAELPASGTGTSADSATSAGKPERVRKKTERKSRSGTSVQSSGNTTVYGRAISKAVDVRKQVETKSVRSSGDSL